MLWKSLAKYGAVVSSLSLVGGYLWWQTGGILFAQAPNLAGAPPSSAPATATSQPVPPRGFMPGSKSAGISAWAPQPSTPVPPNSDRPAQETVAGAAASQQAVQSASPPPTQRMMIFSTKSGLITPDAVPPLSVATQPAAPQSPAQQQRMLIPGSKSYSGFSTTTSGTLNLQPPATQPAPNQAPNQSSNSPR